MSFYRTIQAGLNQKFKFFSAWIIFTAAAPMLGKSFPVHGHGCSYPPQTMHLANPHQISLAAHEITPHIPVLFLLIVCKPLCSIGSRSII